jgi:hypothetical protein
VRPTTLSLADASGYLEPLRGWIFCDFANPF